MDEANSRWPRRRVLKAISAAGVGTAVFGRALVALAADKPAVTKSMIREAVRMLSGSRTCGCGEALRNTIMTPEKLMPAKTRKDLALIIGKYLKKKISVSTQRH